MGPASLAPKLAACNAAKESALHHGHGLLMSCQQRPARWDSNSYLIFRASLAGVGIHIAFVGVVVGSGVVGVGRVAWWHIGAALCGVATDGMAASRGRSAYADCADSYQY